MRNTFEALPVGTVVSVPHGLYRLLAAAAVAIFL
jgi:hypothetical protein